MSNKPTNADLAAELLSMKKDNEQLTARISELHKDIRDIKVTLLDPDNGAIARVNRNTEFRETTSKALWVVYAALVGIIVKIFTGEI
jgi:hypothetical protein